MKVTLTSDDLQAVLAEFQQQTGANYQPSDCEGTLTLPEQFGKGQFRNENLREGMELLINRQLLNENLVISATGVSAEATPILLKFFLAGSVAGTIQDVNDDLYTSSGDYCLVYCPERRGTVEFVAGKDICTVELGIAPQLFRSMVVGEQYAELQQILAPESVDPYFATGKTTPLMAIALQQILQCPYQGAARRLYLESKGLELIALYLGQLKTSLPTGPSTKGRQLKPEDVSRIYQARDILVRNIHTPPSLLSLARQVGINDCKLKRGFRQVFDTTVFGYLHNYRMEQAARLLQANQTTVTGVAAAVGFANRGSFAAAFRRKFGVNPRVYQSAFQKQYWASGPKTPASDRKNSG
ncbi:MAG: AraC family transcriptional regulator [Cyanobacteria bacterium P01_B01_bin.77]